MSGTPMVPLGEVLRKSEQWIQVDPEQKYKEVTVRLWGNGVVIRREVSGAEIVSSRRLIVHAGQFIVSRIDARNGASGLVPPELDGAVVSNDFPTFDTDRGKLEPRYLGWMAKTRGFVELCKAASEGTTNRVRLKEDRFLLTSIPLPPLEDQLHLVKRIETLAAKIEEAQTETAAIDKQTDNLLMAAYQQIAKAAPRKRLGDLAPLTRRPATIDPFQEFPQVSVRSFRKGTFHNPPLLGSEITWEKPHLVKAGDILISNIKAWEGAIAVAGPEDDGRYGSHRYLTYVPIPQLATARFVCFHLLTPEGLLHVGEASPGSADRNRTLNSKALLEVPIPVPGYEQQIWFGELYDKVAAVKQLQAQTTAQRGTLLPAILDWAFKGEL
jgi:type I restriction enzyme, S subunit